MAQDYKIIHFDPGQDPFIDRNGNQWINVLFEGYTSEPTKWVMRPESVSKYHIGDIVHGRLETVEGKNYKRFYKEQAQAYGGAPAQAGAVASAKYPPKDDHTQESIARSVAIKAAVDYSSGRTDKPYSEEGLFLLADRMFAWLQGSGQERKKTTSELAEDAIRTGLTSPQLVNPARPWEKYKKPEPEYQPDNFQFEGQEFPPDDIPEDLR